MTTSPTAAAARPPFDAALDLDGAVADTAVARQAAWKGAFDQILQDPRTSATADSAVRNATTQAIFLPAAPLL
ncbi:hypothetical protein [Paenarthrobacter ureafaciens]|jgi:hypothetical protein|uniref:hypothetical protein n=1 Tax=Paenarthrobacter ureafaciens TaxID=37931 RepID=UPI00140E6DCE|nr:hypothetical protein [Paenarthrobacter ureafaciens]MCX8453521.1 hypothetical protein [Paenarthrobacter ureafaciens]MCY0973180.1 hypothetical protein [Paenarthrobacter ureafaciens]QQQ63928.1 hypothetical protein JHQ56_09160 [Paenarthrobacter ureafaciens]UOD82882.1 hypothetical protein MQZ73_08595 [Paenarthrobacter ureafaciens]WNZ02589.1 hypothetical protein PVT25_13155 [Paenarthrobacter ureafaciens]